MAVYTRVQRSRKRRVAGRKPGRKSLALAADAAEPTIFSTGISCTPPNDLPSAPAASRTESSATSRRARPVSAFWTALRKPRKRAASKASPALIGSRFETLDQGELGLGVEQMQRARVQAQLDGVAGVHL